MGLFGDLSAFGQAQKKRRHEDLEAMIPHLKTWKRIEGTLSPQEKKTENAFLFFSFFWGTLLFLMFSTFPYLQRENYDFWPRGQIENFSSGDFLMAEDGFFGKSSIPIVGEIQRDQLSEVLNYEVQAGESLSLISSKFGIRVRTLLDNNDIPNQNALKTGMILKILPVDGVLYTVGSGDTLSGVSKKFDIDAESIKKQNGIDEKGTLISGKSIIIPGGKKIVPVYVPPKKPVATIKKTPVVSSTPTYSKPPKTSIPKTPAGKSVWPVRGRGQVTQGFHYGHYAIDIWGPNKPDILAMKAGTVIRASGGCKSRQRGCNSGYGNVIVIDHGDGLKTLYAHNTTFYVKVGQKVVAGQAISKMGNTGTVYGRTGIHVHFEVRKNGKRVNPLSYIR